jgi:hypothetical protein
VHDRRIAHDPVPAQQLMLQVVLVVEHDHRHRGPPGRPVVPPALGERGRGGGQVPERAERGDGAALHRGGVAGDRREHVAAAQQVL